MRRGKNMRRGIFWQKITTTTANKQNPCGGRDPVWWELPGCIFEVKAAE